MKKTLSLVLAVLMLASLFTGIVSAADIPVGKMLATDPLTYEDFDGNTSNRGMWRNNGPDFVATTGKTADGAVINWGNGGYASQNFWTGIKDTSTYYVTFWAKGTSGEKFAYDVNETAPFASGEHTFQATDVWEEVSFIVTPTVATDAGTGYPFRVYTTAGVNFAIDEFEIYQVLDDPNYDPSLKDLTDEDGGYVLLQPGYTGIYGMVGVAAGFEAGKTYTLTADMMVNSTDINVMTDMDPISTTTNYVTKPTETGKWQKFEATLVPAADATGVRIYVNQNTDNGQVAVKNIVVTDANGEEVVSCSGKFPITTSTSPWIAGSASYVAPLKEEGPKLTNLFELEDVASEDYMAFQPTTANGYAAYYMRSKLKPNTKYTVTFDMISNTTEISAMVDLEGLGGVATQSVKNTKADTWQEMSVTIKTSEDYKESSTKDVPELGWPLRIYVNSAMDAQVFVDNIVVKASNGKVLFKQNFAEAGIEDIVTWNGGNAVHIPVGYVPEQEGEVLGFNELVNGDFEDSSLMSYWWGRTDWNGGSWAAEAKMGYEGSVGMVARGTGAGTADQNAGCFYTLYGEGKEATLTLNAGKTYVLKYKVFRPEGVDSYTYIDINEGAAVNGTATANGEWETVTARFVAPEGAVKIRMVVNALADGEYVVFDDIELRQVGGDPNGNPKTDDAMNIVAVVAVMVICAASAAVVSKKRIACK